jgi:hypothetical protein
MEAMMAAINDLSRRVQGEFSNIRAELAHDIAIDSTPDQRSSSSISMVSTDLSSQPSRGTRAAACNEKQYSSTISPDTTADQPSGIPVRLRASQPSMSAIQDMMAIMVNSLAQALTQDMNNLRRNLHGHDNSLRTSLRAESSASRASTSLIESNISHAVNVHSPLTTNYSTSLRNPTFELDSTQANKEAYNYKTSNAVIRITNAANGYEINPTFLLNSAHNTASKPIYSDKNVTLERYCSNWITGRRTISRISKNIA